MKGIPLGSTTPQCTYLTGLGRSAVLSYLARLEFRPLEGDLPGLHASSRRLDIEDISSRLNELEMATQTHGNNRKADAFERLVIFAASAPTTVMKIHLQLNSRDTSDSRTPFFWRFGLFSKSFMSFVRMSTFRGRRVTFVFCVQLLP